MSTKETKTLTETDFISKHQFRLKCMALIIVFVLGFIALENLHERSMADKNYQQNVIGWHIVWQKIQQ